MGGTGCRAGDLVKEEQAGQVWQAVVENCRLDLPASSPTGRMIVLVVALLVSALFVGSSLHNALLGESRSGSRYPASSW
jgi:hypothetical protein